MLMSFHDFRRAAIQRLTTAEFLLENGYNLDAQYLGGYTVECALKALIIAKTPAAELDKVVARISSGAIMHSFERLFGVLGDIDKDKSVFVPPEIKKKLGKMEWSTSLRYEAGRRDTGETRAMLRAVRVTLDWVERNLP
jgi:HEPN domain-containing protein